MSSPQDSALNIYRKLSEEQAKENDALRTQIAGFCAQIASLTAQVAAHKEHIRLLEQAPGYPSGSGQNDQVLAKQEVIDEGLPSQDPGQFPRLRSPEIKEEKSLDSEQRIRYDTPVTDDGARDIANDEVVIRAVSELNDVHNTDGTPAADREMPRELPVTAHDTKIPTEPGDPPSVHRGANIQAATKSKRPIPQSVIVQPRKRIRPPPHSATDRSTELPSASPVKAQTARPNIPITTSLPHYPPFFHERLRGTPDFPMSLSLPTRDITVNRKLLLDAFGGLWQKMVAVFSDHDRAQYTHQYTHFVLEPKARTRNIRATPTQPGQPGAFLFAYNERKWPDGPHKLLVEVEDDAYQYMGEYEILESEPLSTAEFKDVPYKMAWGVAFCDKPYYREIRAPGVLHRRLGRAATPEELAVTLSQEEDLAMTAQEVVDAYERGWTIMHVWIMKCVGYDENFQHKLANLV